MRGYAYDTIHKQLDVLNPVALSFYNWHPDSKSF